MTAKRMHELIQKEERNGARYVYHHVAFANGYVSRTRKDEDGYLGWVETYNGRFGKGFKHHCPTVISSRYHHVVYIIKIKEEET